jgi:hypothetical protein
VILVLDDDRERLDAFRQCMPSLGNGWDLHVWQYVGALRSEAGARLKDARLISLDHDLYPEKAGTADPGTGREAAEWLATQHPECPILIHSSNTDAAWGMYNVLARAGCSVEVVHHLNELDWIGTKWLPVARRAVAVWARVSKARSSHDDWLLSALSRPSADRFKSLEAEMSAWPREQQAKALFRIALGANGTYAHYRAAHFLVESEPPLSCSCEEAIRAIAAAPLDLDNQSLMFYMTTQFGKQAIEQTIKRLWKEEYGGKRLPPGLDAFGYWLGAPTSRLRRSTDDWRDFPEAASNKT